MRSVKFGRFIEEFVDHNSAMCKRPVPDNEKMPLNLASEKAEEGKTPWGGDVFPCIEGKVKSYPLAERRDGQGSDCGDLSMPPSYLMQDGGLPLRRPCAANQRG